jgi:cytochrome P450
LVDFGAVASSYPAESDQERRDVTDSAPDAAFDPMGEEAIREGGAFYSKLRSACPFYHRKGDTYDFWMLSDYGEIRNGVLDDKQIGDWTFKYGNSLRSYAHNTGIVTDPPEHDKWRDFLMPAVVQPTLKYLDPLIRDLAERIIDAMLEKGDGAELHDDFALPLTGQVMCMMLGAPLENYKLYKHWGDELMYGIYHDPESGRDRAVYPEFAEHFIAMVHERREAAAKAGIDEPVDEHVGTVLSDDFLSRMLAARIDGRPLTDAEIANMCATFLTAGQETSTSLIMNCVWRLQEERETLWERVVANPGLVKIAIEESLRFDPPVLGQCRTATREVEMHGATIPPKGRLFYSIAGANRDPAVFKDPDTFSLDRPLGEAMKHLSFGWGSHLCIGAPLARLDARIGIAALVRRVPTLRVTGETRRIIPWMNWGRNHMPVAW